MHHIAISLITLIFTSFSAAGKHTVVPLLVPNAVMTGFSIHGNEDCDPFYQPTNYRSIQQDFMRNEDISGIQDCALI